MVLICIEVNLLEMRLNELKNEFNKPIMFTEFGSDAFNAIENQEDQKMQAYYMVEQLERNL